MIVTSFLAGHTSLYPIVDSVLAHAYSIIGNDFWQYCQVKDHYAIATCQNTSDDCCILNSSRIGLLFQIPSIALTIADSICDHCLWDSRIEFNGQVDLSAIATIYILFHDCVCTCWIGVTLPCVRQCALTDSHCLVNYYQCRNSNLKCVICCLCCTTLVLDGEGHGVGCNATCDRANSPLYFNHISSSLIVVSRVVCFDRVCRSSHIRCCTRC